MVEINWASQSLVNEGLRKTAKGESLDSVADSVTQNSPDLAINACR
jgi:hypothetical protein